MVQHHVGQSAPEANMHVESLASVLSLSLCSGFGNRQLHVDVALRVEGERGGGVAASSGPARRTQAAVVVFLVISQHRDAARVVLALVLVAALQTHVTVPPTPGGMAWLWDGAHAPVGVGKVFARGTVLAWIAVTLVDVHLTVNSCRERHTK